ncbi:hypothetical protein FYC62_02375 [Pedobacter aquae]|uniref:DUF1735 domain-containing protein n=1 Tax=Pedobacter aquae TaxID=2605747 RepID=A0A5C0VD28_9SPHI|nr:hypothetical protein [Pedobacter aquae]QEK50638.1 hypothetical protein FYC62_02375 [Pedobacter aquae]
MKLYKFKYLMILFALPLCFTACEKDADQWLKDNTTIIGKLPVITSLRITPTQANNNVTAGQNVRLDLRFWSDDPIDKIELKAAVGTNPSQVVSTTLYQKAYSNISKTDSLLLNYTVPNVSAGTDINMEVVVVNKNTLTKNSTLKLTVR